MTNITYITHKKGNMYFVVMNIMHDIYKKIAIIWPYMVKFDPVSTFSDVCSG